MYTQTVKYYQNLYLDKASFLHSLFKNEAFIFIHEFLPEFVLFVVLNIIYIVHDIFTSIFYNENISLCSIFKSFIINVISSGGF